MGVHLKHSNMKFLVVLSFAVAAHAAPQLLYGGVGIHAIPTVVKQEVKYKTAAFEPVEADTPADATLIELKETERKFDTLAPGPLTYAATGLHLGLPYAAPAAVKVELPEVKTIELPATTYSLGYPYGLGLGYPYGLPLVAAAAAEEKAEE